MTLRIFSDETVPSPRPITLELGCDGDHGLFPAPTFTRTAMLMLPSRQEATDVGWLIGSAGAVLCPECRAARPKPNRAETLDD